MLFKETSNQAIIDQIVANKPEEGEIAMLLFGEKSETNFSQLIDEINQLGISFFGGLFPGIIHEEEQYDSGCIFKKFPATQQPIVIKGLDTGEITTKDIDQLNSFNAKKSTLITFVDGLSAYIPKCLSFMYNHVGSTASFLGGGAGSLSLKQQPCVFTNEGFFQDAAVLALVDQEISLGVKHGWNKLVGPIVATKTDKNIIYELNWENAFEVYGRMVNKDSNSLISKDNFFDIAKGYPFGIFKETGEDIVRDPLSVGENGEIICVADVPENTVLYILKGSEAQLIDAAQTATEECIAATPEVFQDTLLVNCISRALYLDKNFKKELKVINSTLGTTPNNVIPSGILSLGEISSYGEGYLEFYNKTLVLGIFH